MDGRTPSAALGANTKTAAPDAQAANANWNAIVTRSTNPIKRVMDVTCVVLIQLLILMILGDEKYRDTRRHCYVLGPDSILSRLERGDDFGLPLPMAASIRLVIRLLRAQYNLGQDYIDSLTDPDADADTKPETSPVPLPARKRLRDGAVPQSQPPALLHPARAPRGCPSYNPASVDNRLSTSLHGSHPPAQAPPFQRSARPSLSTHVVNVPYP